MVNTPSSSLAELSNAFVGFAEEECKNSSPLYYQLCKQIATDEELLRIGSSVRDGQPVPNSLLAAVHFLLLKNKQESLAEYYPSITGNKTTAIPFDLFKQFVQEHEQEVVKLISHRIVQTNVLTRCNYLLPIFSNILYGIKSATIIDIGTSAGLVLNFDHYEYFYDREKIYGNSEVKLHCEIRSDKRPVIKPLNTTIRKIGIDQNLIDLSDADDLTWLQALIWPDQTERFSMMKSAIDIPYLSEISLLKGDTIADFKKIIESIDPAENLIIFSTHVLYQFPEQLLSSFYKLLDSTGEQRDFHFVSAESTKAVQTKYNISYAAVVLTSYVNQQKTETLIAESNSHGNWIRWIS